MLAALAQLLSNANISNLRPIDRFELKPLITFMFRQPSRDGGANHAGYTYRPSVFQVACNGVDLGGTSRTLSAADFKARIKPVSQPPRQELITTWQRLWHQDR